MKENYLEILHNKASIKTKRLHLRKFTIEDTDAVYSYGSDEQTLKFLSWSGLSSIDEAKKMITGFYSNDGVWAIELVEKNLCIGCFTLDLKPEHEKASFGYVLNKEYWNQGYMTEALNAILEFCFNELDLSRVESTHYVGNSGSGKVMEKCGMKKEGLALKEIKVKNIFRDVVHYRILLEEWNEGKR